MQIKEIKILYFDWFLKLLSLSWLTKRDWVAGVSLLPVIILRKVYKDKPDAEMINHERIHIQQQVLCLFVMVVAVIILEIITGATWLSAVALFLIIVPFSSFFILYAINFIINLIKYRNYDMAYKNIIFEKEAYKNAGNPSYLVERCWYYIFYN